MENVIFETYDTHANVVIHKINTNVTVGYYKGLNSNEDVLQIHNKLDNSTVYLYKSTLAKIAELVKKPKVKSKKRK